jgi:AcrR family transcriptional regulator
VRERELVVATRRLFDERGMQDAPIEEIARHVGIARGLIYRVFSSKEELFVLTVTDYLDELAELLRAAIGAAAADGPVRQVERCTETYATFCRDHPAFLDCSLSLMHRPAGELHALVSESVWLRLGQSMIGCVDQLASLLRAGVDAEVFAVEDPDLVANVLWTQVLGTMHLARIGVGVRLAAPSVPGLFRVDPDDVVRACVEHTLAPLRPPS